MSKVTKIITTVDVVATIQLNESEIRALDALVDYGVDEFLKTFYKSLGQSYLQPHESGLRSFLESVRHISSLCDEALECRVYMAESAVNKLRPKP